MHNSLLQGLPTPPRGRPNTASGVLTAQRTPIAAQPPASADRFSGLRSSLAHLSETLNQRNAVGTSTQDISSALLTSSPGASHQRQQAVGAAALPGSPASQRTASAGGPQTRLALVQQTVSESDAAWREIKDNSARLQQHIALEVRRRAEGQKALQQLVDVRARELAQALENKVQERMLQLHKSVDVLTQRVEVLNKELAIEREKNVRLTQELKYQASQGLNEVKGALELERSQRQEKENLMTKKLAEDIFRLQERLDVERHARDTMVTGVRDDIDRVAAQRHKTDEKIIHNLVDDVKSLKQALGVERDEREKNEEHLAAALSDVVKQVQASLDALNHH